MTFLQRALVVFALSITLRVQAQVDERSAMESEGASASDEGADVEGRALGLYERGVAQLEEGNGEAALSSFRDAFALKSDARYALALAATLQHRGRFTEAVALYDGLLSNEYGPLEDGQAEAIISARTTARAQQATLQVTSTHERVLQVELDGAPIGSIAAGASLTLRVDPGRHFVVAVDPTSGQRGEASAVEVNEGGQEELTLDAPVDLTVRSEPAADTPIDEPEDARPRRWPWILAAVVVAGAVVVGSVVFATRDSGEGYEAGPFPNVEGLMQR